MRPLFGLTVPAGRDTWTPSPAYAQAMAGLLAEKDPVVVAIALEALALAGDDTSLKLEPAIQGVLESTDDLQVKEFALYALLRLSGGEGDAGARAARALFAEYRARSKSEELPQAYLDSPLARVSSLGYVTRPGVEPVAPAGRRPALPGRPLPPPLPAPVPARRVLRPGQQPIRNLTQALEWVLSRAGEKVLLALYPHVLSHLSSGEGETFHEWFYLRLGDSLRPVATKMLLDRMDSLPVPVMESVFGKLISPLGPWPSPQFLKRTVQDRSLSMETRLRAFFLRSAPPEFEWFDWSRFLQGDDPFADHLFSLSININSAPITEGNKNFASNFWGWLSARPDAEKTAIQDAALKSPHAAVRASAVANLSRAETPEILRRALADPSPEVKSAAVHRLENSTRADAAPLVIDLLGDDAHRLTAIKVLKRFADPRSIEPLVKLLDDPDTQVRSEARAALKEIRAALEERKEWEQVLKGFKPSAAEKPREP